jgi:FHS family L-fucose permease-like MFS transporter
MLFVTLFFESICFPTIVALGMRGLGKHSKRGSGWIVAGVCGGAVVPPALGGAADASNTAVAMAVPLAFFVLAWTYALAVNFVPAYRDPIDMLGHTRIGLENGARDEESTPGVRGAEEGFEKGDVTHADGDEAATKL